MCLYIVSVESCVESLFFFYLVELNQCVFKVFKVSLKCLRGFLPVLQRAVLNITSIL